MRNSTPLTREQSRLMDTIAQDAYAIPGIILMENAGLRAADIIFNLLEDLEKPWSVTILTGKGNNGGDGYVIARHLRNKGVVVNVFGINTKYGSSPTSVNIGVIEGYGIAKKAAIAEKYGLEKPSAPPHDADVNLKIIRRMDINIKELGTDIEIGLLPKFFKDTDIIVDSLLGSGTLGAPRPPYDKIIEEINESSKTIVAVDIPSGLDVNSGEMPGACVSADHTVTFAAKKIGFLSESGKKACGKIHVVDISIPDSVYKNLRQAQK